MTQQNTKTRKTIFLKKWFGRSSVYLREISFEWIFISSSTHYIYINSILNLYYQHKNLIVNHLFVPEENLLKSCSRSF